MRKTMILLAAMIGLAALAQTAHAEPTDPIVKGKITVEVQGNGKVTGTGIDCGTDCSQEAAWKDSELPPTNRLTATANPGWAFGSWQGCTPEAGQPNRCEAIYGTNDVGPTEVIARFNDIQVPSVSLKKPTDGTVVGNDLPADANATDNDRIARVVYLVDGEPAKTVTSATEWETVLDVSAVAEGPHQIQARAFDRTGNGTTSTAGAFTADHTGPEVTVNDPMKATNGTARFSFDSNSKDFDSATCVIQRPGPDQETFPCQRNQWFQHDVPVEGEWLFVVHAVDNVGNRTVTRHSFTVDRTAPVVKVTRGPADGSQVRIGNIRYAWTATDGLALTQTCSWDGGEEQPCANQVSRGIRAGTHKFQLTVTDLAGNSTVLARVFDVEKDGTWPDPDSSGDKTAPRIRLTAGKVKLRSLARGLKLKVRCSEACAGTVKAAGKGGLAFKGKASLKRAGTRKLVLKPTAKTVRKLRTAVRSGGRLKLKVRAALRDPAGNTGRAKLKLAVK